LSLPLVGNDETLKVLDTLLEQYFTAKDINIIKPDLLNKKYNTAVKKRQDRVAFELTLQTEEYLQLQVSQRWILWKGYLNFELQAKEYGRLQRLFERLLVHDEELIRHEEEVWLRYISFTFNTVHNFLLTLRIVQRGLHFHPYSMLLRKVQSLAEEASQQEGYLYRIKQAVNEALTWGFYHPQDYYSILVTWMNCHRRFMEDKITKYCESQLTTEQLERSIEEFKTSLNECQHFLVSYYPQWQDIHLQFCKYRSKMMFTRILPAEQLLKSTMMDENQRGQQQSEREVAKKKNVTKKLKEHHMMDFRDSDSGDSDDDIDDVVDSIEDDKIDKFSQKEENKTVPSASSSSSSSSPIMIDTSRRNNFLVENKQHYDVSAIIGYWDHVASQFPHQYMIWRQATDWFAYSPMSRYTVSIYRKLLNQYGSSSHNKEPQTFVDAPTYQIACDWILFEENFGDLKSLLDAMLRCFDYLIQSVKAQQSNLQQSQNSSSLTAASTAAVSTIPEGSNSKLQHANKTEEKSKKRSRFDQEATIIPKASTHSRFDKKRTYDEHFGSNTADLSTVDKTDEHQTKRNKGVRFQDQNQDQNQEQQNLITNTSSSNNQKHGDATTTSNPAPSTTVFINNIGLTATEEDLKSHLLSAIRLLSDDQHPVEIVNIRVARDKLLKVSKGNALVEFGTPEQAKIAVKLNKTEWNGQKLRISMSKFSIPKETSLPQNHEALSNLNIKEDKLVSDLTVNKGITSSKVQVNSFKPRTLMRSKIDINTK
jgi:hypothetical protein